MSIQKSFTDFLDQDFKVKYIAYGVVGYLGLKIVKAMGQFVFKKAGNSRLQSLAQEYQRKLDLQQEKELNEILPLVNLKNADEILRSDVQQLKHLLESNQVTSEELVNLYASRCLSQGQSMQLITESNYKAAIELARKCDQLRQTNPSSCKGEFFGVPVSIKDTFDMEGFPSSIGCIKRLDQIEKQTGLAVKILLEAGAIPFIRSNVPQVAMTFESVNHIYGRAKNPWDQTRATGGSSGGEGALVSSGCSPIGIGSDIGGSIRIPAIFQGICSFKPTAGRLTFKGHTYYSPTFQGQTIIPCALGPIGKTVDDCILMVRAFLNQTLYNRIPKIDQDHHYLLVPFKQEELTLPKKLTIGYYKSIDFVPACSAMQRGVDIAVEALKKAGHNLVEILVPQTQEMTLSFFDIVMADGMQAFNDLVGPENLIKQYEILASSFLFEGLTLEIIKGIIGLLMPRAKTLMEHSQQLSAPELLVVQDQIIKYRENFNKFYIENQLDGIVGPAFATPAVQHTHSNEVAVQALYTFIWNVLNVPCGTLPITLVNQDEQVYNDPNHQDLITETLQKTMAGSKGLPISVQVITNAFEEEKCLAIMKHLEELLQFKPQLPF